jgi:multiple sugar transport system permease protein/raffinose/stachyose/melibiose transport system permease protein
MNLQRALTHALLLIALGLYTAYAAGPFLWTALMSVRTTPEISANPYGWPEVWHWDKYLTAWSTSN